MTGRETSSFSTSVLAFKENSTWKLGKIPGLGDLVRRCNALLGCYQWGTKSLRYGLTHLLLSNLNHQRHIEIEGRKITDRCTVKQFQITYWHSSDLFSSSKMMRLQPQKEMPSNVPMVSNWQPRTIVCAFWILIFQLCDPRRSVGKVLSAGPRVVTLTIMPNAIMLTIKRKVRAMMLHLLNAMDGGLEGILSSPSKSLYSAALSPWFTPEASADAEGKRLR